MSLDSAFEPEKQAGGRMVVGFFLLCLEIGMYIIFRPVLVVIVDGFVNPNYTVTGLASLATTIGWIIEGSWLILVICTIVFLIILPSVRG